MMAYELKISIKDINPVIWRRLRIPGNITFQQLHQIIQAAFGWLDYHLYMFEFDKTIVTFPDDYESDGLYNGNVTELNSLTTKINELFDTNDVCQYEYDLGESWRHEIIIEKRLKDNEKNAVPVCLDGARQRPPEDVGGISGYENFLNIIRDQNNPDRKAMLDWAEKDTKGRIFDPEYFNINEVNRMLMYVLEDDMEHAINLLTGNGLNGKIACGWSDVYIEANGKKYPMEYISNLMLRLGEGCKVTIKVVPDKPYSHEKLEGQKQLAYEDFEQKCNEIRTKNSDYLNEFREDLIKAGLKEKTIKGHCENVDLYINVYLLREEPLVMKDGADPFLIDDFLGYFFIRKCMWSTPATIKSTAASIKKFYKSMLQRGYIEESKYMELLESIKDNMDEWMEECKAYNSPDANDLSEFYDIFD